MQYRRFGNLNILISALGFGCMRLPEIQKGGKWSVDLAKTKQMISKAVDLGINYFDAAYGYCHENCEAALGEALKPYRKQIYLSTKLPMWHVNGPEDFDRILHEQLKRLQTDYIDFYHFHAVNQSHWRDKILRFHLMDKMIKRKQEGTIRHISFSYHDNLETMKEMIDTGIFSTVLCQYNLLDRSYEEGIDYAASKGMGVVIMGPVGGGRLERPTPKLEKFLLSDGGSLPDTALKFVWSNPNVSVALSGMGSLEMLEQNVESINSFQPFPPEKQETLLKISDEFKKMANLYCTGCEYCMPCPKGIEIPSIFNALIYHKVYGLTELAKQRFEPLAEKAGQCVACRQCEKKCPQKIQIVERIRETIGELS